MPGIPGVYSIATNPFIPEVKNHAWSSLPELLGRGSERILSEMLMDCGLYRPVADSSNVKQICGVPLSDLKSGVKHPQNSAQHNSGDRPCHPSKMQSNRGITDVRFLRHRMLYARPSVRASGHVRAGLSHMHVLSRCRDIENAAETIHVMKYIFPRQFGLHNVFTSLADLRDTSQPFMDYTSREQEIARSRARRKYRPGKPPLPEDKIPRRLRGLPFDMVKRLRKRQTRCSYKELLDNYCPRLPKDQIDEMNTFRHASTCAQVSAFCRAAIQNVFPPDAFGDGGVKSNNFRLLMNCVDRFIHLRRYETLSMHDLVHGLSLSDIQWLVPQKAEKGVRMSRSDFDTRKDIMAEFFYYLFDSYLMPLIRSHFYVTESGAHRGQIFYFRHDVWKVMSEPALDTLRLNMFEECRPAELQRAMTQRALGVSKVRLLPKDHGMRPIVNLRRRIQRQQHGNVVLGRSINSVLTPAFSILNYERGMRPELLGSALFSVEDIFLRLQQFRASLKDRGPSSKPLYFAKVDVKSCFDTIPQKKLLRLAGEILSADEYRLSKYARAKLLGGHNQETPGFGAKPTWKFLTKATSDGAGIDLDVEIQSDSTTARTRTAYVGGVVQRCEQRKAILDLLHEHVESNIIKMGNRFYRQKEGIPQGSIVSSLLCSYFYAELERTSLGFVNNKNSTLLRLIDDFLVITTDRNVAEKFLRTMHSGLPEFGVQVKIDKSRANFDTDVEGIPIDRLPAQTDFPYCGNAINTITLDLAKDTARRQTISVRDSVTVEYSKLQGQSFYRKTLNALKLHMRAMHLSTNFNSLATVLTNLYQAFNEVAHKSYSYIKALPRKKQVSSKLIISKS